MPSPRAGKPSWRAAFPEGCTRRRAVRSKAWWGADTPHAARPGGMSDDPRPTSPVETVESYRDLLEKLNRDWRIEGYPPADGSLPRTALHHVRRLLARLLGTQETFNSELVQLVNTLEPILSALDQVERYRESLAARERRMEAAFERL